jgi:hypothetical protein
LSEPPTAEVVQRYRLGREAVQALHGGDRLVAVSVGAAIAFGAVIGLALGILVSVTTDIPLAPEIGVAVGALLGWLSRREGT